MMAEIGHQLEKPPPQAASPENGGETAADVFTASFYVAVKGSGGGGLATGGDPTELFPTSTKNSSAPIWTARSTL